jgi:glycosyltransferase involved in cell wall biosynthesis
MNIGLVYTNKKETQGGGFTFQEEILKEIQKNKDKNKNLKFHLFHTEEINNNKFENSYLIKKNLFNRFVENIIRNFSFFSERVKFKTILDKACEKFDIDLVFFLDNNHSIITNYPYTTIVYDVDHINYPFFPEFSRDYKWYKRENGLRNHLRKATAIITGTEVGMNEIIKYYGVPEKKIFKLPHPATDINSIEIKKNYLLDEIGLSKREYIIYPAQFWAHKNHYSLIALAASFKKKYKNKIKIVLTGTDKGNLTYIKELIDKNNLQEIFVIKGFIEKELLIFLYKNALALTYVSYGGPENLPPLEAFSLGCPVIASKNEGSIEQLGEAAILIDPNKTEIFLSMIEKIKNDEKFREDLILKGLKKSNKWKISDFVDATNNLLLTYENYIRTWR